MKSLTLLFGAILALLLTTSLTCAFKVGPPAPATLEVSSSFFQKVAAQIVPIINEYAKKIVIPGGQPDKHFKYDNIVLSQFDLGPIDFVFTAPDQVTVSLTSLSLAVPSTGFELMDKVLFIDLTCHGHFAVTSEKDSAQFSFKVIEQNGKLALDGSTDVVVNWGSFDFSVKMDHFLCKIGEDIINLFTGGVGNLIKKMVEKDIGPMLSKTLTKALQDAFDKLPVTVTANPQVSNGVLAISIDLDSLLKQQQQSRMIAVQQQPPRLLSRALTSSSSRRNNNKEALLKLAAFSSRDIAIILPAASANTLLNTLKSIGKLGPFNKTESKLSTKIFELILPAAYNACPNCDLNFGVQFITAPQVQFQKNNATLNIANLSLAIGAVNPNSTSVVNPLFTLGLLASLSIDNFTVSGTTANTIHFDLGVQSLSFSQVSSNVGPVPVSLLNLIASIVQTVLLPDFNKAFPGIVLPTNGTLVINEVEIDLTSSGLLKAGMDVTL
jgi:hypothetical protein